MFEFIETNITNNTLVITINRENVYNALNTKSKHEIIKAIKDGGKDENVRSIILTAKGKAFCSGQDLNDRAVNDPTRRVDLGRTLDEEWNPLVMAIRNSEKLVIGAIQGVAAGAGLSVVLACDIKVSSPGVRYICGFTQIGLAPDAGLSSVLVKHLGYSKALEFSLMGKPLLAEELLSFNLINHIHASPLEKAQEIARQINGLAPLAVKMVKKNLKTALDKDFDKSLEQEKYSQRFLGFSDDYQEGIRAFLEKRQPQFKGQ